MAENAKDAESTAEKIEKEITSARIEGQKIVSDARDAAAKLILLEESKR